MPQPKSTWLGWQAKSASVATQVQLLEADQQPDLNFFGRRQSQLACEVNFDNLLGERVLELQTQLKTLKLHFWQTFILPSIEENNPQLIKL